MNYIIENNIDFFSELNKEISNNKTDEICLLTHQQLEENYITLSCGHNFNYIPIYNEVCNQKKDNYLETTYLLVNQIKCPYCRSITNKLLPYIEHKDVVYRRGVNYPLRYCMALYNCQWMKYGKKEQCLCNKGAFKSEYGIFCSRHFNLCKNKQIKQLKKQQIESVWTPGYEKINKNYNVSQLRQILRDNKKQYKIIISGNKKELIHRIVTWGLLVEQPLTPPTNIEDTFVSIPLISLSDTLNIEEDKANAFVIIQ